MAVKEKGPSKSLVVSKTEFDAAMKRIDAHIRSMDVNLRRIRAQGWKMAPDLEALKKMVEVEEVDQASLRRCLKKGAVCRAERDLQLAEDWFSIEEEAGRGCQK